MAVIVRHTEKPNDQFVLLGTGFGMFKAMRSSTIGDVFSKEIGGEKTLAALCGKDGIILWADSSELTVVSIDGQSPEALLAPS